MSRIGSAPPVLASQQIESFMDRRRVRRKTIRLARDRDQSADDHG